MNSRQRRGVILLVLSVLCALGAFAGVLTVIGDVNSKVGPEVTAYRVKDDIAPFSELDEDDFVKTSIPRRWLSGTAITADLAGELRGKTALTTLKAGSLLQSDMLAEIPRLGRDEQEIAIMIDASTGVAGRIHPGDRVNIIGTFKGTTPLNSQAVTLVTNARVLTVGTLSENRPKSGIQGRKGDEQTVPITFALGNKDSQRVSYAVSFAEHVRLALVAPGSRSTVAPDDRRYSLDGDK
ncbi:Flp pilus assembly protein CpaB [Streptomyces bambusae]|uniref:Flp pilus assembly protein CpaB n=1 Tax=Streptomyces bambusae TaxID=1550616 RepID=UPI001CFF700B|nr:Flp pilus assembly protein CpaB [Streptomyces bambusae]MCB5170065.1 Flp pilus assembly protein CpaB [Streptomyces bambusae]